MHQQLQINGTLVPCNSDHWVRLALVTIKEQPGHKPGEDPQVRKSVPMEIQRNAVNSNSCIHDKEKSTNNSHLLTAEAAT